MVACLIQPDLLVNMADDTEKVAAQLDWAGIAEKTVALYENLVSQSDNIRKMSDHKRK